MEKFSCKTIVCSSSPIVYKLDSEKLFKEDDICMQVNPCGYAKLTKERILCYGSISDLFHWRNDPPRYFGSKK